MDKKIGFIGSGNMGKAIIGGIIASGLVPAGNIYVFDIMKDKVQELCDEYGITCADSVEDVAKVSDILFAAVKPNVITSILSTIQSHISPQAIVVSIAAGVTLETLKLALGNDKKIVRVMPNTPALVNAGMSSITPNNHVTQEELQDITAIFNSFGKSEVVPEYLIHAVTGVSGSSPAYVFMFIEAMADAAVLGGMPRAQAYQFAAQAVMGSAKMVLDTGMHPGALKDMVCSPGGTTIEAVKILEEKGMRSAIIEAVYQCMLKSENMSKS